MYMFSWCSTYEPVERNFVHMCTLYVQLNDNKIATYLPTYLYNSIYIKTIVLNNKNAKFENLSCGLRCMDFIVYSRN